MVSRARKMMREAGSRKCRLEDVCIPFVAVMASSSNFPPGERFVRGSERDSAAADLKIPAAIVVYASFEDACEYVQYEQYGCLIP